MNPTLLYLYYIYFKLPLTYKIICDGVHEGVNLWNKYSTSNKPK